MAHATRCGSTESFLQTFRGHVLSPPTEALDVVEAERAEIITERDAFEEFADELEACDVDDTRCELPLGPGLALDKSDGHSMAPIRTAYRETVMGVPHYDAVYGEPVRKNVAAELGPDLAQCLDPETAVSLTDDVLTAFRHATENAIHQRRAFSESLGEEIDSIETAREKLTELVGEFDSLAIPDWYEETFMERLDSIAQERQQTIASHPSPRSNQGTDLCEYLYADESWSYPVLTAVTRLRETIVLT